MIGFMSGRQTHSLVAHLIDKSVRGQKIDLFGYTFDHPEISQALTRAALRGVFVRLTLNAEEVEGKTHTRDAVPVITEMLRRCEEARRDPDAEFDCTLEVWKQRGPGIASVYAAWGRRPRVSLQKRGPLHAKVFVLGPAVRVPSDDDNRVMVMGSTNSTISSESNVELSVALQIGKEGAAGVDHVVRDLRHNATMVTYAEMSTRSTAQERGDAYSHLEDVSAAGASVSHAPQGQDVSRRRPPQPPRAHNNLRG